MQEAEKELKETVVEYSAKKSIAERHRTKAVTMTKAEHFSSYFDESRLFETNHPELFKVFICPHIVVSLKETDLDTLIHQSLESRQNPDVPLRNNIPILVPEIPYISQKI
jgi:hypothetical protein